MLRNSKSFGEKLPSSALPVGDYRLRSPNAITIIINKYFNARYVVADWRTGRRNCVVVSDRSQLLVITPVNYDTYTVTEYQTVFCVVHANNNNNWSVSVFRGVTVNVWTPVPVFWSFVEKPWVIRIRRFFAVFYLLQISTTLH